MEVPMAQSLTTRAVPKSEMPKGVEHVRHCPAPVPPVMCRSQRCRKALSTTLIQQQRCPGIPCRSQRCRKALSTRWGGLRRYGPAGVPKSEMPKGVEHAMANAGSSSGLGCRSQRCRKALSTRRLPRGKCDGGPCRSQRCRKALSTRCQKLSPNRRYVPKSEMPKGVEHCFVPRHAEHPGSSAEVRDAERR